MLCRNLFRCAHKTPASVMVSWYPWVHCSCYTEAPDWSLWGCEQNSACQVLVSGFLFNSNVFLSLGRRFKCWATGTLGKVSMLVGGQILVALRQLSSLNHFCSLLERRTSAWTTPSFCGVLWLLSILAAAGQHLASLPISWSAKKLMMCYFLPSGALHAALRLKHFHPLPIQGENDWRLSQLPLKLLVKCPPSSVGAGSCSKKEITCDIGSRPRCCCPCGLFFSVSCAAWSSVCWLVERLRTIQTGLTQPCA